MFRTITTTAQVTEQALYAANKAAEARAAIAAVPFAGYEHLTRLVDAQATYQVWARLAQAVEYGEGKGLPEAEIVEGLKEIVATAAFGFFGNRSTNIQSNEVEYAEHIAWLSVGRDNFGLGRRW